MILARHKNRHYFVCCCKDHNTAYKGAIDAMKMSFTNGIAPCNEDATTDEAERPV